MNILLLEDDLALNRAITRVLKINNHNISGFFDGADVVKNLNLDFDLYILDINVPNINGLEILDLIYNKNNNVKVIIITSNTDLYSLTRAYELGCIDFLTKPFHLAELNIKINKLNIQTNILFSNIKLVENITLTKKENDLLSLLLEYKKSVVTYEQISVNIYNNKEMSMDGLRALVKRLRSKLVDDIIVNVIDSGYMIKKVQL